VVDLHVDTPWQVHFKDRDERLSEGHLTPQTARDGHYVAVAFVIYIPDHLHGGKPRVQDAEQILGTIEKLVSRHQVFRWSPEPARRPGLLATGPPGTVTVFPTIEGAGAFAEDIEQIDRFIERGVRLVGPVHAHDNKLASSATGKGPLGLTKLGKRFCQRIYERGALVDVSHMSDAAFWDLVPIAEAHSAPLVASHSNARAVRKHPRNLTDKQLRAIGASGGVSGLNLHRSFVRRRAAELEHAVAHALHMIEVAGIDHVALGTDFDGGNPIKGLEDASRLPALAEALRERGLSQADVRKVFSRNALRVLGWRKDGGE
jgi:membrane dipeptidase